MSRRGPHGYRSCRPFVRYRSGGSVSNTSPHFAWGAALVLAALFILPSFLTPPQAPRAPLESSAIASTAPSASGIGQDTVSDESDEQQIAPARLVEPAAVPATPAAKPALRSVTASRTASRTAKARRDTPIKPRLAVKESSANLELASNESRMIPRRMTAPK